jgi:hypothetical protein
MWHRFTILDLLLSTLIVAVHLFHFPLAVRFHESNLMMLVPLAPTLITTWIHLRVRPRILHAMLIHYLVCVSWAFLYGYGYSMSAKSTEAPLEMAVRVASDMAVAALVTTPVYGMLAYCALMLNWLFRLTLKRKRLNVDNNTMQPSGEVQRF